MNVADKLEIFSKQTLKEAEKYVNEVHHETEVQLKNDCVKYTTELQMKFDRSIKEEINIVTQSKNKGVMKASIAAKASLIDLRTKLIDQLFEELIRKINKYMATDEYKNYLVKNISEIVNNNTCSIDVFVSKNDMQYSDILKINNNVNIYIAQEEIIGGFICIIKDKKIYINNSFKQKIDVEHKQFIGVKIV